MASFITYGPEISLMRGPARTSFTSGFYLVGLYLAECKSFSTNSQTMGVLIIECVCWGQTILDILAVRTCAVWNMNRKIIAGLILFHLGTLVFCGYNYFHMIKTVGKSIKPVSVPPRTLKKRNGLFFPSKFSRYLRWEDV